jgi:hypothetical protein
MEITTSVELRSADAYRIADRRIEGTEAETWEAWPDRPAEAGLFMVELRELGGDPVPLW